MYHVSCDGFPLLDWRENSLILVNPKMKLEVNTVGECSFTIHKEHPYYSKLKKLKSVFEVSDEIGVVFRGRMTGDTIDFDNAKDVDLEGSLAFFNDSVVRPFNFPEDYLNNADYIASAASGNVVEFFLKMLIDNHNSQVQDFQKLKLGNVTVSDPNNYISRSSDNYATTWETLKSKLFDSSLGGNLCARYEEDGTYIDYLESFELTNTQQIVFGENLLDLKSETEAAETYSAIIPIGKDALTIAGIADGDISDDIVKSGDMLYSKSAVEQYGFICAPISESTWDDVTEANNLLDKAVERLASKGVMLTNTIEFSAVDLHFTDEQIRSFRIYRNVQVISNPHGFNSIYPLTRLDIDMLNPQNTKITVGRTHLTLTDKQEAEANSATTLIQSVRNELKEFVESESDIEGTLRQEMITQNTAVMNDCKQIIFTALESYVLTENYDEFKKTVDSQFKVMAESISMSFTATTERTEEVNGDLQKRFTELYKYFTFSQEGLVIGSGDNAVTLTLDNDGIAFKKNGFQFGYWDGNYFHTGNIVVTADETARLGNFEYKSESDGSLTFSKVGG